MVRNSPNAETLEKGDSLESHEIRAKLQKSLLTSSLLQSSPRPSSPVNSPPSTGTSTARPSSPPGGAKTAIRRKAAADRADKVANARPTSTRAAGAGGSSSTMLSKDTLSSVTVAAKDCIDMRNGTSLFPDKSHNCQSSTTDERLQRLTRVVD
ncbi:MAG: hypothetical protein Q9177_005415 [Variospora cf. flavescens]